MRSTHHPHRRAASTRPASLVSFGAAVLGAMWLGGCSGGGSPGGVQGTSGNFVVLRTEPANNGTLFLNDPIKIDFSNKVNINTANLNTVSFQVFDAAGNPLSEQPAGTFRLARSPGDTEVGRRLEFIPRFPTNNAYTNGGFKPSRIYTLQLVGGNRRAGNVLLDERGQTLRRPSSFRFQTATGSTPSQLFRDTKTGGPRRVGFSVTGGTAAALLNKSGQAAVEAVVQFDQPLNPHSDNVPVAIELDPTTRSSGSRGRIFMQYDDPDLGTGQWIPAEVILSVNTLTGSEVRLLPLGVLPNNATVEVIVENTLEDMSGESNVAEATYNKVFATFNTRQAFQPQFDALVESFDSTDNLDLDAAFLEPLAEVNRGFVKANFDFEGSATILDYQPTSSEVILNTDFTQVTPKQGPPINVSGGVFQFRNVTINSGVTVRGTGSNPMVWLVTGDFTVDGKLEVNGGNGSRVDTLNAANFPTPGGVGVCGGGNGGRGSPNTGGQSAKGENGFGAGQVADGGGQGGNLSFTSACNRASAGGGGSFATQGDPYYKVKASGTSFVQQKGQGGFGCSGNSGAASRTLPGGLAGPVAFQDARPDNNFWGSGVDVQRQIRVTGELAAPRAGTGGGGGGDRAPQLGNQNWISNNKGGGGGGGAGVLIIKALGEIRIGQTGAITANGGTGGGGEQAGGNNQGGGGGGGSGGMVILMSGRKIQFVAHGETYDNREYTFAISADGEIGTQGNFGGAQFLQKYPPPSTGSAWDNAPSGGMGGMGVVQLMVPAGDDTKDGGNGMGPPQAPNGTGTVLDDNIEVLLSTGPAVGIAKVRYLAWRGFLNNSGIWVDDYNAPTYNNPSSASSGGFGYPSWPKTNVDSEGDIRPAPILLPAPFGAKSRVRTRWLDVGAGAVRVPGTTRARPREIAENISENLLAGPRYDFSATNPGDPQNPSDPRNQWVGYVDYTAVPGGVQVNFPPPVVANAAVGAILPNATFEGQPAYRVTLVQSVLGQIADRFAQYQAELVDGQGRIVASYRILSHDDTVTGGGRTLWLSPDQGPLPASLTGLTLNVVAKFFDVRTSGAPGLGPTYQSSGGRTVPVANVRFGFAFHVNPGNPDIDPSNSSIDRNRFPNQIGTFLYDMSPPLDLSDPTGGTQEMIRQFAGTTGTRGAPFVIWDVLFNTLFSETEAANTNSSIKLSPSTPRPEIHFLVLPYRF